MEKITQDMWEKAIIKLSETICTSKRKYELYKSPYWEMVVRHTTLLQDLYDNGARNTILYNAIMEL